MASEGLHEAADRLSADTVDRHRAITSIMEELEAVDWYAQRVDATDDEALAAVLAHNRDEEKEHAAMTIEWLRRRDPKLDEHLRTYLFTEGDITQIEDGDEGDRTRSSTTVSHLFRHLAPVTDAAWAAIDDEVAGALRSDRTARRLVDVTGPLGWDHNGIGTGRADDPTEIGDVTVAAREVQALVELRVPFRLSHDQLAVVERGRPEEADLDPAGEAARALARFENAMVLTGADAAGVAGIGPASPHDPIALGDDPRYPAVVAEAVAVLRNAGVDGPYALALGDPHYTAVLERTDDGGEPVVEHLGLILDGPVVWVPDLDGGVVLSRRGGDFELVLGQDAAAGYRHADADGVTFFLEASATFRAHEPEAAVRLAG